MKAWIAAQPEVPWEHNPAKTHKLNLEYYIYEAWDRYEFAKLCKGHVLVRVPNGQVYKSKGKYDPSQRAAILARHPEGSAIVNEEVG